MSDSGYHLPICCHLVRVSWLSLISIPLFHPPMTSDGDVHTLFVSLLGCSPSDSYRSSPLFHYTPCSSCDPSTGFSSSSDYPGQLTTAPNTSIAITFTGTAVSFLVDDLPPSATPSVLIDGQLPASPANVTSTSVSNLPYGTHEFKLVLSQLMGGGGVRFLGIHGGLDSLYTAQSQNHTVDDTAWRDWKVTLSPAWNMLEQGASNWINTVGCSISRAPSVRHADTDSRPNTTTSSKPLITISTARYRGLRKPTRLLPSRSTVRLYGPSVSLAGRLGEPVCHARLI